MFLILNSVILCVLYFVVHNWRSFLSILLHMPNNNIINAEEVTLGVLSRPSSVLFFTCAGYGVCALQCPWHCTLGLFDELHCMLFTDSEKSQSVETIRFPQTQSVNGWVLCSILFRQRLARLGCNNERGPSSCSSSTVQRLLNVPIGFIAPPPVQHWLLLPLCPRTGFMTF